MQPMSLLILPVGLVLIRCGMGSPLLFRIHCTSRLVALIPALQVLFDFGLLCNLFLCCNTILFLFKKKKVCLYLVVREFGKKTKTKTNKQTNKSHHMGQFSTLYFDSKELFNLIIVPHWVLLLLLLFIIRIKLLFLNKICPSLKIFPTILKINFRVFWDGRTNSSLKTILKLQR